MRRICIVGPMLESSGYAKTQGEVLADALEESGFKVFRKSKYPNRIIRFLDTIFFLLVRWRLYDIVIVQVYGGLSFIMEDVASWLANVLKKKVIMTLHGGALPEFLGPRRTWASRVFNRAIIRTCPSDFLINKLAFLEQPMIKVPNIIRLKDYPFIHRNYFQPRLLWMRAYHDIYNPHLALDVFELLYKSFPDATLTMAGPDMGLKNEIVERIERSDYRAQVKVMSLINLNEKKILAQSHDIYLNTNRIDNTPVSMIEMAALGLVLISTRVGGIPYLVTNDVNALLAGENAGELAGLVNRIVEEPDLGARLVRNGRELAKEFDVQAVTNKWKDLIG